MNERVYLDLPKIINYEEAKNSITARIIKKEGNEELLESRVYTALEDMAIIYQIKLEETERGITSVAISNELLEKYGISKEELHKVAMENTMKDSEFCCENLFDRLKEMCEVFGIELPPKEEADSDIYVLTNKEQINGAIAIADKNTLIKVSEQIGGNFYILPSSIHEVMIIPEIADVDKQDLEEMVRSVNSTTVHVEEQLSDSVFKFDANLKEIYLISAEIKKGGIE